MRARYIMIAALIAVLLFGTGFYIQARMFSNSSEGAFDGGGKSESTDVVTIRELIIEGAGYFFKAAAGINSLSEKIELSDLDGVDFIALSKTVNTALENMNHARDTYRELEEKANQTPYNQIVIIKLIFFDYDRFQEENNLLTGVFKEVEWYLSWGDVRGVYSRSCDYLDTLIDLLDAVKLDVDAGTIPPNAAMWNLNQTCAKAHMFGQYVARVFEAL